LFLFWRDKSASLLLSDVFPPPWVKTCCLLCPLILLGVLCPFTSYSSVALENPMCSFYFRCVRGRILKFSPPTWSHILQPPPYPPILSPREHLYLLIFFSPLVSRGAKPSAVPERRNPAGECVGFFTLPPRKISIVLLIPSFSISDGGFLFFYCGLFGRPVAQTSR